MKQRKGRLQKGLATLIILVCIIAINCTTVLADVTIKKLTIRVNAKSQNDVGYPDITISNNNCEIVNKTEWSLPENEISPGAEIRCTITVAPKEGYKFVLSDGINIIGKGVRKENAHRDDRSVIVDICYTVPGKLERPLYASWSEEEPWIAVAAEVPNATAYEFKLYEGTEEIKTVERKVVDYDFPNTCNFARSLAGRYGAEKIYFKVKAISGNSSITSSSYEKSPYFEQWWELEDYCYDEGIKIRYEYCNNENNNFGNEWNNINGNNYCNAYNQGYIFPKNYSTSRDKSGLSIVQDTEGYWKGGKGDWYFYHSNGTPANGWIIRGGYRYYCINGKMQTGWLTIGDKKYYLRPEQDDKEGAMLTNWQTINGYWYYFHRISGVTDQGREYSIGEMATDRWINHESFLGYDGRWAHD